MPIKAGDLKHPICLERPTFRTDDCGNRSTTWIQVGSVLYASMKDVSGREFYAAQAYQAQDVVTFGIRWRDDITEEWRIVYHNIPYKIEQINHLGYKRDFMHIKAKAVKGKGE